MQTDMTALTPQRTASIRRWLLAGTALALAGLTAVAANAQATDGIEEIRVTADPVGLLEDRKSESVFGLEKALVDTPRAISVVSETTIDRYAIEDIDDFITTTPGTFGGSFFGLPGAITVRGDISETYFRGFRKVRNDGLFPTPVGASDSVEIIRGIVPVNYGVGRIGGLLNFLPKTTSAQNITASDGPQGSIEATLGSFQKRIFSGEIAVPFKLAGRESGASLYVEYENSDDFLRRRSPEQAIVQATANHDFGNGWYVEIGGQYQDTEGYRQSPGFNRLTQDLIDNGTYITGNDTAVTDVNGNGFLDQGEVDAVVGRAFFGAISNIRSFVDPAFAFLPSPGSDPAIADAFALDSNVGTTQVDRRNVFIGPDDVQDARNFTLYGDIVKEFDDGAEAKLQFFYDDLKADLSVGYGFASSTDSSIFEVRGSYNREFELHPDVRVNVLGQASYQRNDVDLSEYFLSGFLVLDRADISDGVQGSETFATPVIDPNTPFDSIFISDWNDIGVALITDWTFFDRFNVIGGLRYDRLDAEAEDRGVTNFGTPVTGEGSDDDVAWNISASYSSRFGVVPYFTFARANQRLDNVAGGFNPDRAAAEQLLSEAELIEGGIKWSLLDDSLTGSVLYYSMEREQLDPFGNAIIEDSEGFEAEVNWVVNENWAFTANATVQEFEITAEPGLGEFVTVSPLHPSAQAQLVAGGATPGDPTAGYGGLFAALNATSLPELVDGYEREVIPDVTVSAFGTYTSPETRFGTYGVTFGGTYVDETSGKTAARVVLPDYWLLRAAFFASYGNFGINATIENLTNVDYFQPVQGVYEEVAALPGEQRIFRVTLSYKF